MTERAWWSEALQWTAWFVIMLLITSWLARARRAATRAGTALVLVHPSTTRILGVVGMVFFGLLAVVSANYVEPDEWWVPFLFMSFMLLAAATLGEALRVRHELTETGITYQGFLRRYDLVPWNEIVAVQWSPSMKWLVVTARDGRAMRFSALLNGLDSLARALTVRVPSINVDEKTAHMLVEAREGRLPSVWL